MYKASGHLAYCKGVKIWSYDVEWQQIRESPVYQYVGEDHKDQPFLKHLMNYAAGPTPHQPSKRHQTYLTNHLTWTMNHRNQQPPQYFMTSSVGTM